MTKLVLTVDDSRTIREMVSFTLKGAGFDVIEAEDGQLALKAIVGKKPDLIITDLNMPNMDGLTLIRELRAQNDFKSIPILMLTTEQGDDKKAEGRSAGATGWIVKPFKGDAVLATFKKLVTG
jgi:two-component system chemotaxis response regulator CheY